jgi:hypothetical protein
VSGGVRDSEGRSARVILWAAMGFIGLARAMQGSGGEKKFGGDTRDARGATRSQIWLEEIPGRLWANLTGAAYEHSRNHDRQ